MDPPEESSRGRPVRKGRKRRKAKEATVGYLERVAIWYLERYPGSTARVRRALRKRVERSVAELDTDPAEGAEALETVIVKLTRAGLLDDARFAGSRVRVLRSRGLSARAIAAKLRHQGVDGAVIESALAEEADDGIDDLEAARRFARKRRIGPHRSDERRRELREKDLAKMARAGFSFDVARRVIDGALDDEA